jgi:propanol-preferring alcohol dehydrogenase
MMMKAAVVTQFGAPLVIRELPVPTPGRGEALIKIEACGVCHTDLHAANGDWPVKPSLPFIPGHEGVGRIVALGDGVSDLKEGDAVGAPWLNSACGACEYCISGWETLCPRQKNTGYSVNGGFAEYVLAPAAYLGRLPDGVDWNRMAPILCAGVTTYKGLKETEAKPGEWVVICGIGGLGHVAVQYAKAMGLHVVAIDVDQTKLDLAEQLGADATLNCLHPDVVERVVKVTGGGAQGVLVTAVSTQAFGQAVSMARRHGTVVLVGLPPGNFPTPIFEVVLKRITIRGSIVGTRKDLEEAIAFASEGKVTARVAVEPLANVNAVFDRMKSGKIDGRIVLQP